MFSFVILHYIVEEITKQCIESIKKISQGYDYHIVIVDNASPNGSGQRLYDYYINDEHCTVILNDINMGFAKGNNIGYLYAKDKLKSDFIIVQNNDVMIRQENFIALVEEIYQREKFSILGPDIYCPYTKQHQSPLRLNGFSYEQLYKCVCNMRKAYRHFFIRSCKNKVVNICNKILKFKKITKSQLQDSIGLYKEKMIKNPLLQGACYIYSRDYISKERLAFCDKTFMYYEEDILYYNCIKNGHLMLYCSDIQVEHLDDASTNAAMPNSYRRAKNKLKYMIKSAEILLELMKEDI